MSTIECVYTVLFWFSFFFFMFHTIWVSHFFQIHTSIYSFSHSRTGWKTFGHVQLSHKRRSVAGMLITHRTTQWCAEQRSLGCGWGRDAYFIRLSTGVKSCLKWYSLLTDRTTASLLFDFVNRSHDYRHSRSYNHYQSYMWSESLHCRLCQEQAWKSYKQS